METDNDCLQGLLLAPISRGELYIGKVISNFIFMLIAELIILPLFVIFNGFNFDLKFLEVAAIACLGTLAIAGVGTILSTISSNTQNEGGHAARAANTVNRSGNHRRRRDDTAGHD